MIARLGAFINLFNLLPFATLDGGRAFRSMTKNQRWLAVIGIGFVMSVSRDEHGTGVLALLMICGVLAALGGKPAKTPDNQGLFAYLTLVAVLSLMLEIPEPLPLR